jgi:heme-degrading monooxygenase HmoA
VATSVLQPFLANHLTKEGIMAFRVLIKRRFKEGYFNEIDNMIRLFRQGVIFQRGYISSETMWDWEDPFRVVISSTWQDKKSWATWKNHPERNAREKDLATYLDGETEYEMFELGLYPH